MVTIINNPGSGDGGDNGSGVLIGAILVVVVVGAFFFIYGLPAIREANTNTGPTINIPEKIDINVTDPNGN